MSEGVERAWWRDPEVAGIVYLEWPAVGPARVLFLVDRYGGSDLSLTAEEVAGGDRPADVEAAVRRLWLWLCSGRPTAAPEGWRLVCCPPEWMRPELESWRPLFVEDASWMVDDANDQERH